ncbi:DUF4435 domain-containing protein [Mucilaginibacter jinjuensis]|uniref:DUF4435 domain-containing protein n=1 Tax=Mucilaginibacter jinjuensis TaxID=1176721 RepID=A0ABY7T997_9SPHI|nr:DUF4435 domain-containing protein [Mucilaginibacter jinjuensis]WCT12873.1 DUF4435 domain-containing protein [Mucilaginibacter jinjuensis]
MNLDLTVDEIIETLKRSSLTTVLVEGKDDIIIYRWIESEIGIVNANFFPCGGRDKLLQVFERRAEFPNIKAIFVADKDAYVYINPPENLSEIIWTNGYSIENDLYFGRNIEALLDNDEKLIFAKSLNSFIEYYAFEIQNYLEGRKFCFRNHPQQLICEIQNEVKQEFLESINFFSANDQIKENLRNNYDILIRGKSLFALLTRILSRQNRIIKHSKMSLLEHCYRTHRSEKFIDLINEINHKISA